MKISYNWISDYLGKNIPPPEKVEELLTFHAFEIEGLEQLDNDTVIDVDVLPNRSSDCLSHRGIARELATLLDTKLQNDPLTKEFSLSSTDTVSVEVNDPAACRRFSLAIVEGLTIGESPDWLKERLVAIGQRPINNVVDATNYVMFALGQPLHAYDASKFSQTDGQWQFGVRMAKAGEKVTTLTGEEYELTDRVQVITNAGNNTLAGIAGVKGGAYAAVDQNTTSILLEAANFDPAITRQASQTLKLQTDASKRFENEPVPELTLPALQAVVELVCQIAGGHCKGYVDTYPTKRIQPEVAVSTARVNALLSLSLTKDDMRALLERLGADVSDQADGFLVTAPLERTDLVIEEDYVEEIGRIHGYTHIAAVIPEAVPLSEINVRHYYSERIRNKLVELGFSEVITSSFRKKDEVKLQNALASDKGYLRSNLTNNMHEVLDSNAGRADLFGATDTRVFEIGTVFSVGVGSINEHVALCIGVRTKPSGYTGKEDKLLLEICNHIETTIGLPLTWNIEKGVAEINLTALLPQLLVPTRYEPAPVSKEVQYQSFSVYPHVSRDVALWVPIGTQAEVVENKITAAAGELCIRTTLFDEFSKDGRTSYAYRLVFQSSQQTLTDSAVNQIMEAVYQAAKDEGWEVR